MVLANGTVARASAAENQQLFWALRGAAAGFGIITEFTVRTEPEPGAVLVCLSPWPVRHRGLQRSLS